MPNPMAYHPTTRVFASRFETTLSKLHVSLLTTLRKIISKLTLVILNEHLGLETGPLIVIILRTILPILLLGHSVRFLACGLRFFAANFTLTLRFLLSGMAWFLPVFLWYCLRCSSDNWLKPSCYFQVSCTVYRSYAETDADLPLRRWVQPPHNDKFGNCCSAEHI